MDGHGGHGGHSANDIGQMGGHHGHGGHHGAIGHHAVSPVEQFIHITAHPHGSLAVGFEPGLGYAAGHHAAHIGQAHVALADMYALAIAISLASHHGGGNHLEGFRHGGLHEVPAFQGRSIAQRGGREYNLPGIGRDTTSVEVLVWPHGRCTPQLKIRELAEKCKMKRINAAQMNGLADIDKHVDKITTWVPFDAADPVNNLPDGWFPGATGTTHIWREYYQVPHCSWSFFNDPDYVWWRTFLVVSGVTWYFAEMDDYETRVAFTVYSIPFIPTRRQAPPKELRGLQGTGKDTGGNWTYDWAEMRTHRDRAERLAKGVLEYLLRYPAADTAINKRHVMHEELLAAVAAQAEAAKPAPTRRRRRLPEPQAALPPTTFDITQEEDEENGAAR